MASVDSGVDTSNDSSDSTTASPLIEFRNVGNKFLLPCMPNLQFPNFSNSAQMDLRRKYKKQSKHRVRPTLGSFNSYQEKKLRIAASYNNIDQCKLLLENGVDPNNSDSLKRSPLHLASCRGYTEVVRLLIQNGANPNCQDTLGNTPLHLAACTNNIAMVTLLMDAGTDINSYDKRGRSPLQLAQSKLTLIQRKRQTTGEPIELIRLREEVKQVVQMMLSFLQHKKSREDDTLTELSNRLFALKTSDAVDLDTDVSGLLDNLQSLAI